MRVVDKDEVERIAKHAWGAAQRTGMQIAALPLEKRAEAFSMCQEALRESAERMEIAGLQMEGFMNLQMEAIRRMVRIKSPDGP
jgi:phage/plasmid primase-like uncharacterized protein